MSRTILRIVAAEAMCALLGLWSGGSLGKDEGFIRGPVMGFVFDVRCDPFFENVSGLLKPAFMDSQVSQSRCGQRSSERTQWCQLGIQFDGFFRPPLRDFSQRQDYERFLVIRTYFQRLPRFELGLFKSPEASAYQLWL